MRDGLRGTESVRGGGSGPARCVSGAAAGWVRTTAAGGAAHGAGCVGQTYCPARRGAGREERKRASEPIHHLAHLDVLTGLANRTKLAMSLRQHPGRIKRMDAAMAVLAIDLDRFKAVNDLQGYAAGANWAVCRRR